MKFPVCCLVGYLLAAFVTAHAQSVNSTSPALKVRDELIFSGAATPLDLSTNYTTPVTWFDHIDRFPAWRTVPRGFQLFAGVPLDIEGMICLWGGGNTTNLHIVFPEACLGIAVNKKFASLYVYHSGFFDSSNGVPVYAVVFRYADGSSATNTVNHTEDLFDWHAHDSNHVPEPTAARSRQAWVGGAFPNKNHKNNDPLHFTLTELANPQPDQKVQTIDLVSCKSRTAPCVMAMTIGKAGLMNSTP
jgi:hypothetical protein